MPFDAPFAKTGNAEPLSPTASGRSSFEALELRRSPDGPALSLGDFSGPLDLLLHLIKQHRFDIMDLPIGKLTEQYLMMTADLSRPELEQASAFLLMSAELLRIKSRMLLPEVTDAQEEDDPRTELALRLLAYRRCRNLAEELEQRLTLYENMAFRGTGRAKDFGLITVEPELTADDVSLSALNRYAEMLERRNRAGFHDLSEKLAYLTRRESIPLPERMRKIRRVLRVQGTAFFDELTPRSESPASRTASFLSVLELMKRAEVEAKQKANFAPILLKYLGGEEASSQDEETMEDYE